MRKPECLFSSGCCVSFCTFKPPLKRHSPGIHANSQESAEENQEIQLGAATASWRRAA